MKSLIPFAIASTLGFSAVALAQTTPTPPAPTVPPKVERVPATPPASTPPIAKPADHALTLTDAQAKSWIDKAIYSSDGKNLGEVAAFVRDSSGKVSEMHADVGGFLGIAETRVRIMPSQFHIDRDRVVLDMTAAAAKSLPVIPKS